MHCPRCNQPMQERVRRHKDGSRDVTHVCKRHPLWQTLRERRDATDAQVRVMRRTDPWAEAPDHKVVPRFDPTKPPGLVLTLPELAFELPTLGISQSEFDEFLRRQLEPRGRDFRNAHDIMRWIERNTGLCCNVWLDDDKLTVHVSPLADYYPHQQRSATEMLRDVLPIHVELNWHWRCEREPEPNVTPHEAPAVRQDGIAPPITWQALVDAPVLARQSKPNEPPAGSDLVIAAQPARSEPPEDGKLYVQEQNGPRWEVVGHNLPGHCPHGHLTRLAHDGFFHVNSTHAGSPSVILNRICDTCNQRFEWYYPIKLVEEPKPAREGCGAPRGIIIHGHRGAPPGSTFVMPDYFEEQP